MVQIGDHQATRTVSRVVIIGARKSTASISQQNGHATPTTYFHHQVHPPVVVQVGRLDQVRNIANRLGFYRVKPTVACRRENSQLICIGQGNGDVGKAVMIQIGHG